MVGRGSNPTADLGNGRGWADAGLVASIHRIDTELGTPVQITEAGRSEADNQAMIAAWNRGDRAGLVYPPSPNSSHLKGLAIDTNNGAYFLSAQGQAHGFTHPIAGDPVHFEYDPTKDKYANKVPNILDALNPLAVYGKIGATLSNRNTWVRIGLGIIGATLLIIALTKMFSETQLAQELTTQATTAVKGAGDVAAAAVLAPK